MFIVLFIENFKLKGKKMAVLESFGIKTDFFSGKKIFYKKFLTDWVWGIVILENIKSDIFSLPSIQKCIGSQTQTNQWNKQLDSSIFSSSRNIIDGADLVC